MHAHFVNEFAVLFQGLVASIKSEGMVQTEMGVFKKKVLTQVKKYLITLVKAAE